MIEVKGVVKRFGDFAALDGLDMHVPQGSVYGLLGPNGAGKTTILRHLSGMYRQDEGEVTVFGEPVYDNPDVKRRIAYIPDDVFYFFQYSTRDMMQFYRGMYPTFDMKRYEALKQVFHIDERAPIRRLSKGMQKQTAFWLALSLRPDLLILDEPVDGLDPVMRRQMWSMILDDVAAEGATVLLSSHNLREMEDVCDHVGILNRGRMILQRSLLNLEEDMIKVQLVMPEGESADLEGLQVLNYGVSGRIETYIIRGSREEAAAKVAAQAPVFYDLVPLTLEEIFIYELGGVTGEVKDIVL